MELSICAGKFYDDKSFQVLLYPLIVAHKAFCDRRVDLLHSLLEFLAVTLLF